MSKRNWMIIGFVLLALLALAFMTRDTGATGVEPIDARPVTADGSIRQVA